jgi:adenine-specific DNA-methyltransferase
MISPQLFKKIIDKADDETDYYKVAQKQIYDGDDEQIRLSGLLNFRQDPLHKALYTIGEQGVLLGDICNVNQGIVTGADKVSKRHIEKYSIKEPIGSGIFVINKIELLEMRLNEYEKSFIRPWYKNSDIYDYYTTLETNEYLIDVNYSARPDIDKLPNIKKHLQKFETFLRQRPKPGTLISAFSRGMWYVLTTSRQQDFTGPKIVAPQRSPRTPLVTTKQYGMQLQMCFSLLKRIIHLVLNIYLLY